MSEDDVPIVIDNGSSTIRVGFAYSEKDENSSDIVPASKPHVIIPNAVGRFRRNILDAKEEVVVGHCLEERRLQRRDLKRIYPIKNGIIDDMDIMEEVWKYVFSGGLNDHPVLMTEAVNNSKSARKETAEIMFEKFKVPGLYLSARPSLSLINSGRVTGLVLQSGFSTTHAVPVYEGCTLPYASQTLNIGGKHLTDYLKRLLSDQDQDPSCINDLNESKIDEIKKDCRVVSDYEHDRHKFMLDTYTLSDGRHVNLNEASVDCPEALFQGHVLHYADPKMQGIHDLCKSSIEMCDKDMRAELCNNIVLSGGNTMFSGLADRLQKEMENLLWMMGAAPNSTICVIRTRDLESVWKGGAMIASHPSFSTRMVSQQEYSEVGATLIHKKWGF